jgi:hypothetical protein
MDHDFVCIAKQRSEECFSFFFRGLDSYIDGDWVFAQSSFQSCAEKLAPGVKDGPLEYMLKLMEKTKAVAPEDWDNVHAFDWDKKPIPPEVDFMNNDGTDSEDSGADGS